MDKQPWDWDETDLQELVGQAENYRLEFKSCGVLNKSSEAVAKALTKEVSAFANSEGGTLIIGIDETPKDEDETKQARVAVVVEDGIDPSKWPPERIQRLIEGNLRPHLTGLRVKPIPLGDSHEKYACVIVVPKGITAYQASDKLYYSRSEYEAKALFDDHIRLLMFRGKAANAELVISSISKSLRDQYIVDIAIKNTSEVDIERFKLSANFKPVQIFSHENRVMHYKPGAKFQLYTNPNAAREAEEVDVVYPHEEVKLITQVIDMSIPSLALQATMTYTLYLPNTLPVEGTIHIGEHLKELLDKK